MSAFAGTMAPVVAPVSAISLATCERKHETGQFGDQAHVCRGQVASGRGRPIAS